MCAEGLAWYSGVTRAHEVLVSIISSVLRIGLSSKSCLENKVCSRKYVVIHKSKANSVSKVNAHVPKPVMEVRIEF